MAKLRFSLFFHGSHFLSTYGFRPYCVSSLRRSQSSFSLEETRNELDGLNEERKSNLFQFLLRDLQVEGVPLLEVDVMETHTMQTALWTTMAEMQVGEQKACLLFQELPVETLRAFVDDFASLQDDESIVGSFSELKHFNVTLVGKGVGPAIVLETNSSQSAISITDINDEEIVAIQKKSVAVSEFLKSLEATEVVHRVCNFGDAFHLLAQFWNCVCETRVDESSTARLLACPAVSNSNSREAFSNLVARTIELYDESQSTRAVLTNEKSEIASVYIAREKT